ncbi:MAG: prohibitin family protein [bacterium]|nr:prohibitin family protein [bacterium]
MSTNSQNVPILKIVIILMLALVAVGCGTQIQSGERGVKYFKFGGGTEMGTVYPEGFAWHMPWNTIYTYKIQTQEAKESLKLLTADGATVVLDVSVWYRPVIDKLDSLQITIGPNYFEVVVAPALRGESRSIAGKFTPEELYSTKRDEIAGQMLAAVKEKLKDKYIEFESILIRDVTLPQRISDAINEKLASQQEAQRMEFILQREQQEAERKRIEAQGIADFQKIVSAGINDKLLEWKGIETTEKLAQSPNAKIVIIGNSKNGLPLILGQ